MYRQRQQPALTSHRRTARNERIPPDGFDTAALEATLHRRTSPPASLVPLPFQGRQDLNNNVANTGKGNNRRWQATGGQRGTSEFRRTVLTRLPWKLHFTGEPLHPFSWMAYMANSVFTYRSSKTTTSRSRPNPSSDSPDAASIMPLVRGMSSGSAGLSAFPIVGFSTTSPK